MLKKWEEGDPELRELWERMNGWAISGIEETYRKTGVSFDRVYYESDTYLLGRDEVLKGFERNTFYQEEDGSIWADLTDYGLDKKVLLRSDGTSLYLTQDIGTAVQRRRDWPFDRLIYVVASEQRHHFQVLLKVLELLGFDWSKNLHHLSYGMVNLPQGKMKSREGTVVDADNLIGDLKDLAAGEIKEKERESEIDNLSETSEKIALAALNYFLLEPSPYKDIIFNPRESISFSGNTGPYLQYTGARISSMLRKFLQRKRNFQDGIFQAGLLSLEEEWRIIKQLSSYPDAVELSARELNPSIITLYLYELSKSFSRFYHDHPVLHNKDPNLVVSRITLAKAVLQVLQNGFRLIGIPFLEKM
ncbi:Arginine--tRNA ligase [subsurface metagenome]